MLIKIKNKIKNKSEIFFLIFLIFITVNLTGYYNYAKKKINNNYNEIINNIYFKKTSNHFLSSLEPKFKKIRHQISVGETFDIILNKYSIDKKEIQNIKIKLSEKVNLNKLNTNQKIYLTINQSDNTIKDFIFQISNKERVLLTRNKEDNNFNKRILLTKLEKKILYQENLILKSLYKSATDKKIPIGTIIEFARIYGFQVDFQRDIRKQDRFQIMYEIFIDENKKIIETGDILFANLILSGEDNSLYYFN